MFKFTKALAAQTREFWDEIETPWGQVFAVLMAILVSAMVLIIFVVLPIMAYVDLTSEPSLSCGEGQHVSVTVEEVRFSKHNYGYGEVARCK